MIFTRLCSEELCKCRRHLHGSEKLLVLESAQQFLSVAVV